MSIISKISYHYKNKNLMNVVIQKLSSPAKNYLRKRKEISLSADEREEFEFQARYGFKMLINKNKVVEKDFYLNNFESEYINLFRKLIRPNDVILDIGANVGIFSLVAASKYKTTKVFAFEPADYPFRKLNQNISLNKVNNIIPNQSILSNKEEDVVFNFCEDDAYNSMGQNPESGVVQSRNMKAITLDKLYDEKIFSKIDIIKIDTEGAEYLILSGGKNMLLKNHPIIFTEYNRNTIKGFNYSLNDYEKLLNELGYCIFELRNGHLKRFNHETSDASNLICVKDEFLFERLTQKDYV